MSEHKPAPLPQAGGGADTTSPEQDHTYHYYTSNVIPWSVRVIWLGFWIFAVWYVIKYLFPTMQVEMISPP